jgi:hypothetical protein
MSIMPLLLVSENFAWAILTSFCLHILPAVSDQHTVTIWDRIIDAPWLESKLELDDIKGEYPVMDHQVRAMR